MLPDSCMHLLPREVSSFLQRCSLLPNCGGQFVVAVLIAVIILTCCFCSDVSRLSTSDSEACVEVCETAAKCQEEIDRHARVSFALSHCHHFCFICGDAEKTGMLVLCTSLLKIYIKSVPSNFELQGEEQ